MSHEELRARLQKKLSELTSRVEKVEGDLRRTRNPLEKDWSEAAVTLQNDEVLEGIDEEIATEIQQLHAAIVAIDEGKYGTCEACLKPIANERLEALPQATLCIDCARRQG